MRITSRDCSRFFSGLASVCVGISLALHAPPAWSQSTASGTVSGQVVDQSKAAVAAAQIKLTDVTTNGTLNAMSNDSGRFTFVNVPPGNYNITISKQGFNVFRVAAQKV